MKIYIFFVLITFSTIDLFSQIEKGNFIISADGNYMEIKTGSGVITNESVLKGKYLSIGASLGYFITDKFIVGIGLEYDWNKEIRSNRLILSNLYHVEELTIKSTNLLPNLYFGYYYQIINKLYFNTNLKVCYGKIKSDYSTVYAEMSSLDTSGLISSTTNKLSAASNKLVATSNNSEFDFFSAKICPELSYFIFDKISVNAGLGGIEYSIVDWKSDNSNWTVNFNPAYWRLGIKIKI